MKRTICLIFVGLMLISSNGKVFAETKVLECNFRIEIDQDGNVRDDQARIGKDPDTELEHRVWAEFNISSLAGKTVKNIGLRVFNNWSGTQIKGLRYSAKQPSADTTVLTTEHTAANRYSGFLWTILPDNAWTPNQTDFFRPDWTAWKRNIGAGNTLIQDIQAHIDGNKSWFAVEFDCFQCTERANLRFPEPNAYLSNSIVMEVQTETMSGDINNDGKIDLRDVIMGLQVTSDITPSTPVEIKGDIDGDSKIGIPEVSYDLQKAAELR